MTACSVRRHWMTAARSCLRLVVDVVRQAAEDRDDEHGGESRKDDLRRITRAFPICQTIFGLAKRLSRLTRYLKPPKFTAELGTPKNLSNAQL